MDDEKVADAFRRGVAARCGRRLWYSAGVVWH